MIIKSLLDTDLYKFTMMQVVLHQFPAAQVEYRYKCRNTGMDLRPYLDEIRAEIHDLCQLRFSEAELAYLGSLRFIKSDFIDFLGLFHLPEKCITVSEGEGDGDGDERKGGNKEGKGRPKRLTEEERRALRDQIREAVLQAAQAVGAGNLPGGVKRLLKDLTKPVVNWRDLLEQQIQSTVKNDFTWMRPSRRAWHMDAVLPGMIPGTQIDVCIAIDTSGSIGEADIKAFMSEVQGIMEAYDEYKIQVWSFDTNIYNHQIYTSENMDDAASYQPQGGGGTDFEANWTYMKENDIQPKKFIMFTDGCPFGSWGDPDYCDTVFIIKGNERAEPPFGVWAIYEHAAQNA